MHRLTIHNILLLTTGALTLLIALLVAQDIYVEVERLIRIESLKRATQISDQMFDAEEKLSEERDITYSMQYAQDEATVKNLQFDLESSRKEGDKLLGTTLAALKEYDFPELAASLRKTESQVAYLQRLRSRIDANAALPPDKRDRALSERWFAQSTELAQQTEDLWMGFIARFADVDSYVTMHVRFKQLLRIIMEYSGRQRALIGRLIVENADPTPQEQAQLLQWQGVVEMGWNLSDTLAQQGRLVPAIAPHLRDARSHYFTVYDMVKDFFYVPGVRHGAAYPLSVEQWFELATGTIDSLYALKEAALKETHLYMGTLETQTRQAIVTHSLILLFAVIVCIYSFLVVVYRVIRPINEIVEALLGTIRGESVAVSAFISRQDEIGKLAQVLNAFQQNMQEIKRTTAELERYTHALERSNQELDDFAYIASHDLKEPLRGLFNHASFLIEDYQEKLDEDGVRRLHRLSYLSQRMERLVNDLLYFSRLGRTELAIQETDPGEVIHEIEQMMESFLKERNASIVIPRPMPPVVCDKPRVTEVFRNLITNAVKYNDKPERLVEVGFLEQVDTKDNVERNVFYVKDNGIGIEAEFFGEIFRIFKRLQRSAQDKESGTGVGLTFVKKIVERHGGRIWLDSAPGKGTTFYFNLNQGVGT